MPHVRSRKEYQNSSVFDKGRIVAYRDCGLSYRSIAARTGQDPMTICKIFNLWVQGGNSERRAGFQRPLSLAAKKTGMLQVLMGREASSRVLSQELGSFAR
ncbi:HTH_Tnp_Tc3_2 domain-containing protein [Trichonephila clavipes]|nr:HTH_Tnp_Tc3_2 domain-containing protein [Trichonephila clavipes]